MREGQEMALQLENEKHADKLKELKDEFDHLLEKLTYETIISNWPLKVLPIVMENQAGTAGGPMLNILTKNNLCNILVVVTRYFGGILLGTGGLWRSKRLPICYD